MVKTVEFTNAAKIKVNDFLKYILKNISLCAIA